MRLSKNQAALLNARELRLVTGKGPWQVSELATRIRQLRGLRDRQRDLLQRQDQRLARAGKGRVGAIGVANERTAAKERLLDEALDELQRELRRIDEESTQACRELLDCDEEVPGRRANPKKAARRAASGAKKTAKTAGTRRAAKTTTAAAKQAGGARRAAGTRSGSNAARG